MEQKRLAKSLNNKVFSGVCGGIAEYFDVDPVLVRIAFVIAFFVNGIGLIAYIVGMIAMPKPDYRNYYPPAAQTDGNDNEHISAVAPEMKKEKSPVFGFVLVALGILLLLHNFFSFITMKAMFPVVIIALGAAILIRASRKEQVKQ